jgi:hypothetical protein
MSTNAPARTTRWLLLAGGAVVVLVVVFLVVRALGGSDDEPSAGSSPDPDGTSSASPTAGSSSSSTPSAGASKTPKGGSTSASPTKPPGGVKTTSKPVGLDAAGPVGDDGTTVRVVRTRSVAGKAELPGEIAGPSIAVDVAVKAGRKMSLDQTVVNLFYGPERTPAVPLSTGTKPLSGSLAAGKTKQGTYIFTVPKNQRGRIVITADVKVTAPVVVFKGAVR